MVMDLVEKSVDSGICTYKYTITNTKFEKMLFLFYLRLLNIIK